MKKKRVAAVVVALVLVLSFAVTALAVPSVGIGDILGIIANIDPTKYTQFNEQEWSLLTPSERAEQINFVISDQKGTSYITSNSDFINDVSESYDIYSRLIDNTSFQSKQNNFLGKSILESQGLADFGMGYYNSNGLSGGKFGQGTVADTLNDEFLDYIQKYPYVGQGSPSTAYKFSNGYYVDWEPLLIDNAPSNFAVGNVKHSGKLYGLRFYLHDETGKIIDMVDHKGYNSYTPLIICDVCGGALFDNFTITSEGEYYFDYHPWEYPHDTKYNNVVRSATYGFPWWSNYGAPTEEPVIDAPVATGTDDNGNQIQFNINSDGVIYEGNTYNYNDDNSVTINGNTYYITVNPDDVDDDYYNKFLQQVINNYYNYYNTDSTPFDDKDILSAIKSVFTSLETFRSYCYSQLKQITDYVFDGFNSMRSSMKTIIDNLKDILKQLKKINKSVGELTEEQEEKNNSDWADLISLFKDKVGWSALDKSMRNIQTAFFGERAYTQSSTGEIQVQILQKNAAPLNSSMPELSITYMGQSYNLYSLVPYFGSDIEPIKQFISLFLWVGFILAVFRSIPSILGGVGGLQKNTHFMSGDGD